MYIVLPRGNDALGINPPIGVDGALSLNGSNWLWAVTAVHLIAFLALLVLCFTSPPSDRVFHYTYTVTLLVGSVAYFAQAADLGWVAVEQADHTLRQIFYAKYINWAVAFPSFAMSLGLLSGVSWTTIFCNIAIAWLWILTYLAAALTTTVYKWGFFAFGTLSYVILAMSTINESHESALIVGVGRDYRILSMFINFLWLLYPVAFGLTDGGNIIGVTGGSIFFGVLDLLSVPVFCLVFMLFSRGWDFHRLQLDFSEYRGERNVDKANVSTDTAAVSTN